MAGDTLTLNRVLYDGPHSASNGRWMVLKPKYEVGDPF